MGTLFQLWLISIVVAGAVFFISAAINFAAGFSSGLLLKIATISGSYSLVSGVVAFVVVLIALIIDG